ncbi:MAG: alpha-amylase [Anaerolineaceae bacterium]|nr:alpha-amylase [Anaerolineaceae bacterium]
MKFEFHISKRARDKYQFEESLFETNGNVLVGNFHAARLLASKINNKRDLLNHPESAVRASDIYAMGLMDEIFHFILRRYREEIQADVFIEAVKNLEKNIGVESSKQLFSTFLMEFPPQSVYQKKESLSAYLETIQNSTEFSDTLEEILLLWVENQNPALENYYELFSEKQLSENSPYKKSIQTIYTFFEHKPPFGPDRQNIIELLRAPALKYPNSLQAQLDYIRTRWESFLGDLIYKLLTGIDFIKEEEKATFFGPGPSIVPDYNSPLFSTPQGMDIENFSPDKDWMPSLVLIAKNVHVWLDQLSKKYNQPIQRLDQIPDEELANLGKNGFSGLWLIGLWERSTASARIKQLCGNPEAIASAYSLKNYEIAHELGGYLSYTNLRERAWAYGIRLASDMVPNHMGIDSDWVYDHPDWFIHLDYSPYPSYRFNGPNLSNNDRVEIKLEDHYYDRTDAAVVFRHHEYHTNRTRYIYHGNDGTTMPWNDTAQLNYLNEEVREAVYQTILSVARKFPIIRFDAAMTLAKKHYQRLWFPEPGTGGAIPSRAEFGLTKEQFDQLMPVEFWREVVDRLAVDAPDTLLLAEAFWLMESYFVRTLGMHRVYNSAFMNMLRNEDNANYRKLIKNTIAFDPEIMKRFVNFMNNPDEKTAVEQFGKGDKYFGVCTLMSTLPGLPMFGHGQIEGFAEKYGMEYKRAYWDETPDQHLIQRHQQQIFPILHRRWMFAEVDQFRMYDFYTADQSVNEDVYAYSNFVGDQASLVVYHNRFAHTQGWINMSCPINTKYADGTKDLSQATLGENLHIDLSKDYVIFKDLSNNLEYIRPALEIKNQGLFIELYAYQSNVFVDFRSVHDDEWFSYRQLSAYLNGKGVPSIENAMKELFLQPVQHPFKEIFNRGFMDYLLNNKLDLQNKKIKTDVITESERKAEDLINGVIQLTGYTQYKQEVLNQISQSIEFSLKLPVIQQIYPLPMAKNYQAAIQYLQTGLISDSSWIKLFAFIFCSPLGSLSTKENSQFQSQSWFSEWQFSKLLRSLGQEYGYSENQNQDLTLLTYTIIGLRDWYEEYKVENHVLWLRSLLSNSDVQTFLKINRYQGQLWFNKEQFESLVWWLFTSAIIQLGSNKNTSATIFTEEVIRLYRIVLKLIEAMENSNYLVDNLISQPKDKIKKPTS